MSAENPFKSSFKTRTEEKPRAMTPEELRKASVGTDAAVKEGLGTHVADQGLAGVSDEALEVAVQSARAEVYEENDRSAEVIEAHRKLEALSPEIDRQFNELAAKKDTLTLEQKSIVNEIQHRIAFSKAGGTERNITSVVEGMTKPAQYNTQELIENTHAIFTPDINEALKEYHHASEVEGQRKGIAQTRRDGLNAEARERGTN